jgi:hypothetical protein
VNKRVIIPVVREANRLRARQGLPPIGRHVTPHTLRKTYIALLLEADAPVSYVQAQVGHLSSKTTLEIYAYVLSRKQRGEVGRKIELILGQAANPSSVDGRLPIPSSSEYALSAPSAHAEEAGKGRKRPYAIAMIHTLQAPTNKKGPVYRAFWDGRGWFRTSDLSRVNQGRGRRN